jgi:hypothetical protein
MFCFQLLLLNSTCANTAWTLERAASDGQLEVLQWIRANDTDGDIWDEVTVRRFGDHRSPRKQEVLRWLRDFPYNRNQ